MLSKVRLDAPGRAGLGNFNSMCEIAGIGLMPWLESLVASIFLNVLAVAGCRRTVSFASSKQFETVVSGWRLRVASRVFMAPVVPVRC